jgi:Ca2+-binding RTX toxin-like protein
MAPSLSISPFVTPGEGAFVDVRTLRPNEVLTIVLPEGIQPEDIHFQLPSMQFRDPLAVFGNHPPPLPVIDTNLAIDTGETWGTLNVMGDLDNGIFGHFQLKFSNGVVWSANEVKRHAYAGSAADDRFYADSLRSETFRHATGSGNDWIYGFAADGDAPDQLVLANRQVSFSAGEVIKNYEDFDEQPRTASVPTVVITQLGSDQTMQLYAVALPALDSADAYQPATIRFADGASMALAEAGAYSTQAIAGSYRDDALLGTKGHDTLLGFDGQDLLIGGNGADLLLGGGGNDILRGDAGNDTLWGGLGNDKLTGGQGNDTYLFGRGAGRDTIADLDTASNADELRISGAASDQLWFTRSGKNLNISVIGTRDQVTIQNWFAGPANHVEAIQAGVDALSLDHTQVNALVTAMAAFKPPALDQLVLADEVRASLHAVLTSSWH